MIARGAVTVALVALATASRAQAPYSPPLESPTTATATATPSEDPSATKAETSYDPTVASSGFRGLEAGLGALAGKGAGVGEIFLLADFTRFALGAMTSVGLATEEIGEGLHLVGGPRFRVSDTVRIDVLADVGLVVYGGGGAFGSGSGETLGAAGVRAGVTFTSGKSGYYLSLGAGIRHAPRTDGTYTQQTCTLVVGCGEETRATTYGGTVAGGFLTFGRALRSGR